METLTLEELRLRLEKWNWSFFSFLEERKELVKKLQRKKSKSPISPFSPFPHFDPHREWHLFSTFRNPLLAFSLTELLSYSLIMESHASLGQSGVYPSWSQKIHLEEGRPACNLWEMINPLLLKATHEDLLRKVDLAPWCISLLNEVEGS